MLSHFRLCLYRESYILVNRPRNVKDKKPSAILRVHEVKPRNHLIEVDKRVSAGVNDSDARSVHIDSDASCTLLGDQAIDLTSLKPFEQVRPCEVVRLAFVELVLNLACQDLNSVEHAARDLFTHLHFMRVLAENNDRSVNVPQLTLENLLLRTPNPVEVAVVILDLAACDLLELADLCDLKRRSNQGVVNVEHHVGL